MAVLHVTALILFCSKLTCIVQTLHFLYDNLLNRLCIVVYTDYVLSFKQTMYCRLNRICIVV